MNLTSKHATNKFSDWTEEEKKKFLLGFIPSTENDVEYIDLPAPHMNGIDWREKGAVTAVKDQGQCGSCWAFSTTGAVEGMMAIKTGEKPTPLSEQELVSCDHKSLGCNGGNMRTAIQWVADKQLETETDYPYVAKSEFFSCKYDSTKTISKVSSEANIKATKDQVIAAVEKQPVSIAIEADQTVFQTYTSGIIGKECGDKLDHGVLMVGYGTQANGETYGIVKNSWGPSWGDQGYVLLSLDQNACGCLNEAQIAL